MYLIVHRTDLAAFRDLQGGGKGRGGRQVGAAASAPINAQRLCHTHVKRYNETHSTSTAEAALANKSATYQLVETGK